MDTFGSYIMLGLMLIMIFIGYLSERRLKKKMLSLNLSLKMPMNYFANPKKGNGQSGRDQITQMANCTSC